MTYLDSGTWALLLSRPLLFYFLSFIPVLYLLPFPSLPHGNHSNHLIHAPLCLSSKMCTAVLHTCAFILGKWYDVKYLTYSFFLTNIVLFKIYPCCHVESNPLPLTALFLLSKALKGTVSVWHADPLRSFCFFIRGWHQSQVTMWWSQRSSFAVYGGPWAHDRRHRHFKSCLSVPEGTMKFFLQRGKAKSYTVMKAMEKTFSEGSLSVFSYDLEMIIVLPSWSCWG